jgi:hypothetical protein
MILEQELEPVRVEIVFDCQRKKHLKNRPFRIEYRFESPFRWPMFISSFIREAQSIAPYY